VIGRAVILLGGNMQKNGNFVSESEILNLVYSRAILLFDKRRLKYMVA
jgi:hypothetical protein